MIGQKLGPYKIIDEVGKGGMATVYRAEQPSVNRDVAIKLIRKSIADSPDAVQRFQREARLIARLEHIHILPVYDFDGSHNPPYIVMRYLEGGTLKEIMKQGILPIDEVAYLFRQVCAAVDYAHRQGIMHRDLKPSNVMVDREGNTFVTDFGIARIAIGDQNEQQITETGAIVGTPDYMSPEQAQGDANIDYRTDIYALGVMLYEMLTGELPFTSTSPMAVLVKHIKEPVPSILDLNPVLPDAVDEVIERVLAKDPDLRYDSAADLADALTDAIGGAVSLRPSRLQEVAGTSIMRRIGDEGTGSSTTPSEQNKLVTAMYANAVDYAGLVDEVAGSEASRRAMQALWDTHETLIEEHGGQLITRTENELFALWGVETAQEDDAEQAIFAALAMRNALKTLGAPFFTEEDEDELPLNIGLHSGVALLAPNDETSTFSASGGTINTAYRLMQQAFGIIRITHEIYRQVRGVFDIEEDEPLRIRGSKTRLTTYRVEAAKARAFRVLTRGVEGVETQMVGRLAEFKYMQDAFLNAIEDNETQVLTVISEAGLGKSRLLYEFRKWADLQPDRYWLFEGRASSNMTDRPYALLRDVVSFRFEIQDSDPQTTIYEKLETGVENLIGTRNQEMAHFVGHLVGFDLSDSPHIKGIIGDAEQVVNRGTQWLIRLLQGAMEQYPLVIVLEDIHQTDNASLDFLNRLFTLDKQMPLLVVSATRPALMARRPDWGSGQRFHRQIELQPLTKRESRDFVAEILQNVEEVPRDLRDTLVERAEGNPYYIEELVKVLIDDRVIIKETEDQWTIETSRLEGLAIPNTLLGLLEARFDTLLAPEKLTLQRAAVVGRIFYDSALRMIDAADTYHVQALDKVLDKLVQSEFIYKRETSAFADSDEYIFASNMFRDAIANALLERQIRVYNKASGDWLVEIVGERNDEYLSLIADYYESAGEDKQAAEYWLRAGMKSLAIAANDDAKEALERAYALNPQDPMIPLRLAEVEFNLSGADAAQPYLDATFARLDDDDPRRLEALVIEADLKLETAHRNDMLIQLEDALPKIRARGATIVLARALLIIAGVKWLNGELDTGIPYVEESLVIARELENASYELRALNLLGILHMDEPHQAMSYFQQVRERGQAVGNRTATFSAINNIAALLHKKGDSVSLHKAIRMSKEALLIAEDINNVRHMTLGWTNLASTMLVLPQNEQDVVEILRNIHKSLSTAIEHNMRQVCVQNCATFSEYVGQYEDTDRALQLLQLARVQPEYNYDTELDLKDSLEQLNATMADLEAQDVSEMDFDTVMHDILQEIEAMLEQAED